MTTDVIHILHDPTRGNLPAALADVYAQATVTAGFDGDTRRCGRCNREQTRHVWQLIDPDELEQDGVLGCGIVGDS